MPDPYPLIDAVVVCSRCQEWLVGDGGIVTTETLETALQEFGAQRLCHRCYEAAYALLVRFLIGEAGDEGRKGEDSNE